MTPTDELLQYRRLESLFTSAVDSTDIERSYLLASLADSEPQLACQLTQLLLAHDKGVESLDNSPISGIAHKQQGFSLIDASLGDWRIVRHIGQGGWADVYEARQSLPDRACALKVLRWPWLCTDRTLRRFRDEADLLARVVHPGIAHVYGAGVASLAGVDVPYLALELVPDATPITLHAHAAALNTSQRLNLFADVCDAVQCAHLRGVLHRDLKPSNVIIGSDFRPRVIDFGIAYVMDHAEIPHTSGGEFVGTVGFMCPESLAATGNLPDARWDVYSLGVILYELLVLAPPHSLPPNFAAAAAVVRDSHPIPPGKANPALSPDLCTIIETAIERDPARRYQSVADCVSDIRRFQNKHPISARPTPLVRRIQLAAARRPGRTAALACSILGIAAVLGTALGGWNATAQERHAAESVLSVLDGALTTARSRRTGDEIRVSDLLETAEQRLRDDPEISPRAAAQIHELLGRTYENLADYDTAMLHYRAGLKLGQTVWNDNHPLIIRLEVELAGSLYDRGDPHAAANVLEKLLARKLNLMPLEIAKIKNDLSVAYMRAEEWEKAEPLLLEAHAIRTAQLGGDDPATIQSLTNLGANALRLGELETARQRLSLALEKSDKLGPDSVQINNSAWTYLGLTLAKQGEFDQSAKLCAQAEQHVTRVLGTEHPVYLWLSLVWAEAALCRGEWDSAVERAVRIGSLSDQVLGIDHSYAVDARHKCEAIIATARKRGRS